MGCSRSPGPVESDAAAGGVDHRSETWFVLVLKLGDFWRAGNHVVFRKIVSNH